MDSNFCDFLCLFVAIPTQRPIVSVLETFLWFRPTAGLGDLRSGLSAVKMDFLPFQRFSFILFAAPPSRDR